jgi:hypothetical protein
MGDPKHFPNICLVRIYCQKNSAKHISKAPLILTPNISQTFAWSEFTAKKIAPST